jgi:hypothetical protein
MNFAVVCFGKMSDYVKMKELIKKSLPNVKVNFTTACPEYLFVLKKSVITPEQIELFKKSVKKNE